MFKKSLVALTAAFALSASAHAEDILPLGFGLLPDTTTISLSHRCKPVENIASDLCVTMDVHNVKPGYSPFLETVENSNPLTSAGLIVYKIRLHPDTNLPENTAPFPILDDKGKPVVGVKGDSLLVYPKALSATLLFMVQDKRKFYIVGTKPSDRKSVV